MDIKLTNSKLQAWKYQLARYFTTLNYRFPLEVQQDALLREMLAAAGKDGQARPMNVENGAHVLRILERFMHLALATSSPPSASRSIMDTASAGTSQPPSAHAAYSSATFQNASSQIRLAELLPGVYDDSIAVRLHVAERSGGQAYEALSYVWGARDADVTVAVNGHPLDVSTNLAEALRSLRRENVPRVLWVDAICINQSDDAEKSCQVAIMGDIYRNAAHVLILLGGEKDDSNLVMDYLELEQVDRNKEDEADTAASHVNETVVNGKIVKEGFTGYRAWRHVLGRIQHSGIEKTRLLAAANVFFKQPWWYRVWTVQEFALARGDPVWCRGRRCISSPSIQDELIQLIQCLAWETQPHLGSPETISNPDIGAEGQFATLVQTRHIIAFLLRPRHELWEWDGLPLLAALVRFQFRQSTDQRDYIYALREMLDPIAKHVFVPDYTVHADAVFVKASSYLLVSDDRIDSIYEKYELLRSPNMPSWALDFAKGFPVHAQGYLHGIVPGKSGHPKFRPAILGRTMRTSGIIIDTLDVVVSMENAGSDMGKLGLLWSAECLLQNSQPREVLLEAAKTCVPRNCLLPIDPSNIRLLESSPFMWQITPILPGAFSFCLIHMMSLVSTRVGPRFQPDNLTCHKWKAASQLSPSPSKAFRTAMALLVSMRGNPETFYAGACFDYDNLKARILGVAYHGGDSPRPPAERGTDGGNEVHSLDEYKPQYAHITNFLRGAGSEAELNERQTYFLAVADQARAIFNGTLGLAGPVLDTGTTDPQAYRLLPGLWLKQHQDMMSSYHSIRDKCSCGEGPEGRDEHRRIMKILIDGADKVARQMPPSWELMTAKLAASFHPDSIDPAFKLFRNLNSTLSSIFTTRWGFSGCTFQKQACLRKGDVIAVLDWMTAPVVLEEVAQSGKYRLKAVVNVHGIQDVDIEQLTELGVCVRRSFDIV